MQTWDTLVSRRPYTDWRGVSHIDMKISCPSCGASFNIKLEALGSSGRKVKCGKCTHLWHALPDGTAAAPESAAPALVSTASEPPADAKPVAQTQTDVMPDVPLPEPDEAAEQQSDSIPAFGESESESVSEPRLDNPFAAMLDEVTDTPPPETGKEDAAEPRLASGTVATGRRLARRIAFSTLATAAGVIVLAGGAIFLQPQITSLVPAAAALYAQMGLQIDIPGLGLKIVEPKVKPTDKALEIVGEILNETKEPLQIPAMQARLLDGDGQPLKVWQFQAAKSKIGPGETVKYKTEFRNPPSKAKRLDITFTRQKSAAHGGPELARSRPPQPKPKPKKREPGR